MARFLIDVSLPRWFSPWSTPDFVFAHDIGRTWTDSSIWSYAREHTLVIVTNDADYSDRAILHGPPPGVVHLRLGNMRMRDWHAHMSVRWPVIAAAAQNSRLVVVYRERMEVVE